MFKLVRTKKGFTLIELLVVIAIIGILAAVVVLAINPVQMMQKSRDAQRKEDIANLSKAIGIYVADTIPPSVPGGASQTRYSYYSGTTQLCCNGDGDATDACTSTTAANAATSGWLIVDTAGCAGVNIGNYIAKIPSDPNATNNGSSYQYITDATGTKYSLCVDLEVGGASSEVFKQGNNVSACTLTSSSR